MISAFINKPGIRNLIDSLPQGNSAVKIARAGAKALLFRKRIFLGERLLFPGLEDSVWERCLILGPGRDESAIQTLDTAISPGTEKGYFLDLPNFHQPRPYSPGYSGCGRVKSVGKEVTAFHKGDVVAGVFRHTGVNITGGEAVVAVPADVKSHDAAFVTLGVIAFCGVRAAGMFKGRKVVVAGQGIIGQLVDQIIRMEGANSVIAVALSFGKRKLAETSGVDEFIALKGRTEPLNAIAADVVIDSTGSFNGFENSLEMVKPGGRVVMLGSIPAYSEESDWARLVVEKGIEVRGAHVRNLEAEGLTYRDEAARFLNLLAEKKVRLDHLITDVYKPVNAPGIYRRLASGDRNMVGVTINWQSS